MLEKNKNVLILNQGNKNQLKKLIKFSNLFRGSRFIKFPRLSLRGYPESQDRARVALERRTRAPEMLWLAHVNYVLLKLQYNWCRHYFESNDVCGVVWNGLKGERYVFATACRDAGRTIYYLEGSPVPGKITVDSVGVNFLNSLPRDIEFYKGWAIHNQTPAIDWQSVVPKLVARKAVDNPNVLQKSNQDLLENAGNFLFCPLQVPSDSQIKLFSGYAGGVAEFIQKLSFFSRLLPDGWHVRVKEHPSSEVSYTSILEQLCTDKFVVDNDTDTFLQVRASKAVLTINSSVGLQALFFERPVAVLGHAFFGISGVADVIANDDQLMNIFKHPDVLKWNASCVSAYLNYLVNEYYVYDA